MTKRGPILLSLLAWGFVWEIGARAAANDLFPPLSQVCVAAFGLLRQASFWDAALITIRSFALGMVMALVTGVLVGALMGRFRTFDRILNVWVNIFLSAPLTALVPAFMPILGIGEATVVATVFLFVVWVVIIDTRQGVLSVSPSLIEMARTHGATRWQMFSKILLPSAMPEVMTGVRLGVVRGIKGVIIGQIVVSVVGFGGLFDSYLHRFQMERFWALVMTVFIAGFALMELVGALERRLTFHAKSR